jgi:hypothetical protein
MALMISWSAVLLVVRVDFVAKVISTMCLCLQIGSDLRRTVGSGGSAAVCVVPESVNVYSALSIGIIARDVPAHGRWAGLGGLLKGDGALDVGIATENGNYTL